MSRLIHSNARADRMRWGLAFVLAALTLVLFWPALDYNFVKLDDAQYVCDNPHVRTGLSIANVRWAFTTVLENWWLPALWISYMIDVELFGPGAFGFHFTNMMLHTVNVVLLFWILCRCTGARWSSFFVAAFFAFHPLRVESVAWISERKDVLSGLFFFLAWFAYLRYVERPGTVRFGAVFALMLLGLLSKAILIVLPFLFLLLDYWPLRRAGDPGDRATWPTWRRLLAEKIPLFFLSAIFITINLHTHVSATGARASVSLWLRLGLIAPNYYAYLGKIFWPARLSIVYPPHDVVSVAMALIAGGGLLAITFFCWHRRAAAPWNLVGWLWFLGVLFPMIRGVRMDMTAAYADRFTYLPSIGLGIALVWSTAQLVARRPVLRIPAVAVAALLLLVCAARTARRLPDWRDSLTMFSDFAAYAPDSCLANRAHGFALLERGRHEESLPWFARAAQLDPRDTKAPADYADALLRMGRNAEAITWLQTALAERDPACPILNSLLAYAELDAGRADLALEPLRLAVAAQPANLGWRIELVRTLFETCRPEAAQAEIARMQADGFTELRSFDDLIPYYVSWWRSGEKIHAWHFFQNAISNQPDHVLLLNAVAWLLATDPAPPTDPALALHYARQAVERVPGRHSALLDTLAAAQAANGQYAEALQTAQEAIALAGQRGDTQAVVRLTSRLVAYRQNRPWRDPP